MHRNLVTILAAILIPFALIVACARSESRPLGLVPGSASAVNPFSYVSGADGGTVTVPANTYVTSIWSGTGSFTIAPVNQFTNPACDAGQSCVDAGCPSDGGACAQTCTPYACAAAGTSITVPAAGLMLDAPPLIEGPRGLADGTVIVFAAGTSYAVTLQKYGP